MTIKPAILYKQELNELLAMISMDKSFDYFTMSYAELEFDIKNDQWAQIQLAVIDKSNSIEKGNVIGYLSANIQRPEYYISELVALNFLPDKKVIFGKAMKWFIDHLLNEKNFIKIKFSIVCGNPIEKTYDRIIKNLGGRIVGIFKKDALLQDNKYYDRKYYEILK